MSNSPAKYVLVAPAGFDPEVKTRGRIIVSPAYTYEE